MNRIVLVGNGFDLAHNLPTKYEDFINWYWEKRIFYLRRNTSDTSNDILCSLKIHNQTWLNHFFYQYSLSKIPAKDLFEFFINEKDNYEVKFSPLFDHITKSIKTKGWVDIENEYYIFLRSFLKEPKYKDPATLNKELDLIKDNLIEYLKYIQDKDIKVEILNNDIKKKILEPIKSDDISVDGKRLFNDFEINRNNFGHTQLLYLLRDYYGQDYQIDINMDIRQLEERFVPDNIMLLNFNYTKTADMYLLQYDRFKVNHIHGDLKNPDSVIFGYGDELDINYKDLSRLNDNEYLHNIKSIKYLESSNYRNVLSFIESEPYQIYIMGHSCGNSDRTLLNTLFEHNNCVSIKPFYYKSSDGKDNYLDIVQNISRNFTDMKLMRDRVVNKTFCEPLPQNEQVSVQKV